MGGIWGTGGGGAVWFKKGGVFVGRLMRKGEERKGHQEDGGVEGVRVRALLAAVAVVVSWVQTVSKDDESVQIFLWCDQCRRCSVIAGQPDCGCVM